MKKINVLWIILDLIFLIIFNALFFVLGGTDHNTSVWMSYGFIHFAYLMLIITPILTRKGKSSSVFGFSLYSISSFYFLVQLTVGVVFILLASDSYTAALLTQLIIAGLYGIMIISNMIANENTADAEEKRQYQIEYVKDASARLKGLVDKISDKTAKKKVEKVYDALYSSPVKSHPSLAHMESNILLSINEISNAVSAGNNESIILLADSLLIAVNERNRQQKMLN